MKAISKMKHYILLALLCCVIGLLAFSLEGSEINSIQSIEIEGANYLSPEKYLEIANLSDINNSPNITINVIQDRLMKHPYINNVDVSVIERGIVRAKLFEKKMEAVLLVDSKQFIISEKSEIIPLMVSTKSIDLPVIVNPDKEEKIIPFHLASKYKNLRNALNIITTADVYDKELSNQIFEINLNYGKDIILSVSDLTFPINIGTDLEIEKIVYLSKIIKHLRGNNLSNYMNYLDLRFTDLVYLGFDNKLVASEGKI